MRQGRGIGTSRASLATLVLSSVLATPAFALTPSGSGLWAHSTGLRARPAAGVVPATRAQRAAGRLEDSRRAPGPPVTHRPATSGGDAIEVRRDDGRGRRRLPETRVALDASRRGPRCRGRVPGPIRERQVAAHAAVFYDAHAPPGRLLAVAGQHA